MASLPKQNEKKTFTNYETIKFVIPNFEQRSEKREESIYSPIVKAHGYEWKISVYPRGVNESSTEQEHVSVYLFRQETTIELHTGFIVRSLKDILSTFQEVDFVGKKGWGWRNFMERERVLQYFLDADGSLAIEFDIKISVEQKCVWFPKKLDHREDWQKLYKNTSSQTSDVAFLVGKRLFWAHKEVLSHRCKKLFEFAEDNDDDENPIPIPSISERMFELILEFVYTVGVPEIDDTETAQELLKAADLLECTGLKLYAESLLVQKFLGTRNAVDMTMFADSYSCALLKEASMNLVVISLDIVQETATWSELARCNRLLKELVEFSVPPIKAVGIADPVAEMNVTSLREELQRKGLSLDGSREMLVKRLLESKRASL